MRCTHGRWPLLDAVMRQKQGNSARSGQFRHEFSPCGPSGRHVVGAYGALIWQVRQTVARLSGSYSAPPLRRCADMVTFQGPRSAAHGAAPPVALEDLPAHPRPAASGRASTCAALAGHQSTGTENAIRPRRRLAGRSTSGSAAPAAMTAAAATGRSRDAAGFFSRSRPDRLPLIVAAQGRFR